MASQTRRTLVVWMSMLEAILDQTKQEIAQRKQTPRTTELLGKIEAVEDSLTALQRCYYDVTLTDREYARIARGLTVMEAIVSGRFGKDREEAVYQEAKSKAA